MELMYMKASCKRLVLLSNVSCVFKEKVTLKPQRGWLVDMLDENKNLGQGKGNAAVQKSRNYKWVWDNWLSKVVLESDTKRQGNNNF